MANTGQEQHLKLYPQNHILFYKAFFWQKKTANLCTINELTDELLEKNFNDINDKESSEWKESDDE